MDYESMAKKDNPFEGLSVDEKKRLVVYFCYVAQPVMTMEEIEGKWGSVLPPDEKPTVFDAMQITEEIRKEMDRTQNKSQGTPGGCFSRFLKFIFFIAVGVLAIIGGITVFLEVVKANRTSGCGKDVTPSEVINVNLVTNVVQTTFPKPKPRHGQESILILPGGEKIEMIYCAPATFLMGSPVNESGRGSNETQHCVTLTKGFWLSKYKVNQAQWIDVMEENPSETKGFDLPVAGVSWIDCSNYVDKINAKLNCGARLPTEAEWEYACRETKTNRCRFVDMQCGMMEWCNDWYDGDYSVQSVRDPRGANEPDIVKVRILRGGRRWISEKGEYTLGSYYSGAYRDRERNARVSERFSAKQNVSFLLFVEAAAFARPGYYCYPGEEPHSYQKHKCYIGFRLCCTNLPIDDK